MSAILSAGSHWLHLTAAVAWLGGIAFILFLAMPSARQVSGVEAGKLMGEISRRFSPVASYSIILLIATGSVLTAVRGNFSEIGNSDNNSSLALIVKLVLVSAMIAVHYYRGFALAPKIARTEPASEKASLQKLSLNLVKLNICLGLLVLLLSGIVIMLK